MNSRKRYQFGSLTRKKRSRTEDVWEFRYYETTSDGGTRRRAVNIGTVADFPTQSQAMRAVEAIRLKLNAEAAFGGPVSVAALIEKYLAEELPERYSTRKSYVTVLRRWIQPRWGNYKLRDVKTVAVEQWLRSLSLAPKTKTHVRNLFHLLFQNARRWELVDRNPIELVRQGSKRLKAPRVLTIQEVRLLLQALGDPYRDMVLIAVCLGLRVSEIIGLQWGDFDWTMGTLLVRRSVVQGHVGDTKTEYSRRPLPLDPDLAVSLRELRGRSFYCEGSDWVFANDAGKPRWQESILKRQIQPLSERIGIGKIGWHTFRHTYSTMLRALRVDIKVQQELLRHADMQTTMNVYTQAVSEAKRDANSKVVQMVLRVPANEKEPPLATPVMIGS